ncbi:MAG: PfkB family carbohydrate kinase [Prevotella sp.]|jgi:rfaE bifunctional protein nucleotidyltransferase chain/domain|nr:PfkB family carbohydrate kinase [Prevotella sp.]
MGMIITKQEYAQTIKPTLRADGKNVVLCHGVFDLIHPGHIIHFEEAKSFGDILVVSITASEYVRKGPDRPYFDDNMRLKFLSSLECVDYCMLSEDYTVRDIVECVEPDVYAKGEEYSVADNDVTGKIVDETALVESHGGKVKFTTGQVFSSTKLLNTAMSALPDECMEYMQRFVRRHDKKEILDSIEAMRKLKVLVVGDVIIDRYVFCSVQGLMSKNIAYSARHRKTEEYLGGSLAIARQIARFSDNVTLCSIIGEEKSVNDLLGTMDKDITLDLVKSKTYPTIIKERFVGKNPKRDEIEKFFVINNIPFDLHIDDASVLAFREKISKAMKECDAVVLADFGHGLIDKQTKELIEAKAPFLSLNCQTNSSNYGMNLITKYKRADAFSLDEKELKLAFSDATLMSNEALRKLSKKLGAVGWHTIGSEGVKSIDEQGNITHCPAFVLHVIDTIGAGDAFFSVASLCAALKQSVEIGTFLGNATGALATRIIGNDKPVEKVDLLKYIGTLMNV